ncbi:putative tellurite resistance protein B-like protein [Phyllobacterium ifriqiyense]|uniref:Tellurite resistance protein B-like protein n=1 Tax=Phyllobacterium ifriqiyense TaxID=314238 RepID=A0ABU0S9A9_9HYPH|nr:TerB family tellurite resistance protein [Phyllobacterium ifriqiyense]MDQ0997354.1 putative tellurite resistance protein B-like protein [Phyllobacterium ifriqiyense]
MLDRLVTFFKTLPSGESGAEHFSKSDPRLAAAALLFHVMDADGSSSKEERKRVSQLISNAYGLKGEALKRLLNEGEQADQEAVDLYSFTSIIKRNLDEDARIKFIELMWEVVFADGVAHELEDNVVWRVAELIGVSTRDRVTMKQRAAVRAERDVPEE